MRELNVAIVAIGMVVVAGLVVVTVAPNAQQSAIGNFKNIELIDKKVDKIQEEINAIYGLIEGGNSTKFTIMDTEMRIFHYISGHDFRHPIDHCPECGLLEQLSIRKKEVNDEIVALSEYVVNHPDDPYNVEKNKKINELTIEANYVTRYILGSSDRAKELGKLMYKRIAEENREAVLGTPEPIK